MIFPDQIASFIISYFNLTVESTAHIQGAIVLVVLAVYFAAIFGVAGGLVAYVLKKKDEKNNF